MKERSAITVAAASLVAVVGAVTSSTYGFGGCTPSTGPDVIVGDLNGITNYTTVGSFDAFSIGTTSCNIGNVNLQWVASSVNHPVIPQNMYRLKTVDGSARFEQIGQSWMKHAFTALTQNLCCTCNGQGGSVLGIGCSDPYTASRNGAQITTTGGLGPRFQVNAHRGAFIWPYMFRGVQIPGFPNNDITRRLQVHVDDLNPALNAGASYIGEAQYVTPDDAGYAVNNNNSSYRLLTITGANPTYSASMSGTTVREKAAIQRWKTVDPTVTETLIDTPEAAGPSPAFDTTGRMILSAKATDLGGGIWHYEYALYNMNSDRAADGFVVPIDPTATVTNIGFHDVRYHSGDGHNSNTTTAVTYDGTDWPGTFSGGNVSWSLVPATPVENSNALRWGTLYNFRFDANRPPKDDQLTIDLFKLVAGQANTVLAASVVPDLDCNNNNIGDATDIKNGTSLDVNGDGIPDECAPVACPADTNKSGAVDITDLLAVVAAWGSGSGPADVNGDGNVDIADLLLVVGAWGPCP